MENMIPLSKAAYYERIPYDTLRLRIQRNPANYLIEKVKRVAGGKPMINVAISSLSAGAQKRYYKANPQERTKEQPVAKAVPEVGAYWFAQYSSEDFARYREQNPDEIAKAEAELPTIREYLNHEGRGKTALADTLAARLGIQPAAFFNRVRQAQYAIVTGERLTKETGIYHGYLETLALCRKPSERNKFPTLTEDMRAVIEQAFFGEHIQNRQNMRALCEMALQNMAVRGLEPLPSESMMIRYFKWLMEDPVKRATREYQAVTKREWKNRYMVKGKNDTSACLYLEHVQGDTHTLDFWSEITHANGKRSAARLQLVTWIDVKTRRIVGYQLCRQSNSEIIAESVLSVIYGEHGGVPKHLHIDNGKDFTAEWLTGQSRKEHADNGGWRGLFKQLGIEEYSRSKPYEPWGKAIIERFFNTMRGRLSCKQPSYTGTLTGKATADKIPKDIDAMLKAGQLPTMERTAEIVAEAVTEYNATAHRGLKDSGEAYPVPDELMAHCEHYDHAPIRLVDAKILVRRREPARVTNQGIRRFNQVFDGRGLERYIGQTVIIRYSSWDKADLIVTDMKTKDVICTAYPKAMMKYGDKNDPVMIESEIRKKRQVRELQECAAKLTRAKPSPRSISSAAGLDSARDGKMIAFSDDPEVQGIQRGKKRPAFVSEARDEDWRELEKNATKYFDKRAL